MMKVEVVVEVEPPVTYSAPRGCGAADCWLTMVGGGVWKTGQDWMSTSVCTEERTSENNTNQFHLFCAFLFEMCVILLWLKCERNR